MRRSPFFRTPTRLGARRRVCCGTFPGKERLLSVLQVLVVACDAALLLSAAALSELVMGNAARCQGRGGVPCPAASRAGGGAPYLAAVFAAHAAALAGKWYWYAGKLSRPSCTRNLRWMMAHNGDALLANTAHSVFAVLVTCILGAVRPRACSEHGRQAGDESAWIVFVVSFLGVLTLGTCLYFVCCEILIALLWGSSRATEMQGYEEDVGCEKNDESAHQSLRSLSDIVHVEELSDCEESQ